MTNLTDKELFSMKFQYLIDCIQSGRDSLAYVVTIQLCRIARRMF